MRKSVTGARRRIARRLLVGGGSDVEFDLTQIRHVPRALRVPLLRDGMDPTPRLAELRSSEPLYPMAYYFGRTVWVATSVDLVRDVLADKDSFSNDIRHLIGSDGVLGEYGIGGLGFTDPPDHTRLRKILTPEFTLRRLDRLRPRIDGIVESQLDALEAAGPVTDLIPNFAFPIPFLVICELLGLPDEDRDTFRRVANARFDVSKGSKIAFGAASRSRDFFLDVVRRQRVSPGDGLIGAILTELGDEIDDVTLSGLADGVFLGGVESSATMLTLGTLVLLEHPEEIQAMLAGGPSQAVAVVDELLRYLSVVQVAFPRFAKSDMTIAGRDVKAGDVLICSLSGANRDPALGADLERFDPHRGPTPHMAFGHGFHRCVGAELAKMELRAAYPALFSRFPELRLQGKVDSLKYRKLSLVFGIESLPVHLGQPGTPNS